LIAPRSLRVGIIEGTGRGIPDSTRSQWGSLPMATDLPRLSLLHQREIEARIVGPIIRAVSEELGREKTLELLRRVISELARQGGADLAGQLGEATLSAFSGSLDRWREGGALEIEMLENSEEQLSFNVTRCRYAEMYRALGLAELGSSLSCQRDFSLVEGFNPGIHLSRTQTLMDGAPFCDFRFEDRSRPGPLEAPEDERPPEASHPEATP